MGLTFITTPASNLPPMCRVNRGAQKVTRGEIFGESACLRPTGTPWSVAVRRVEASPRHGTMVAVASRRSEREQPGQQALIHGRRGGPVVMDDCLLRGRNMAACRCVSSGAGCPNGRGPDQHRRRLVYAPAAPLMQFSLDQSTFCTQVWPSFSNSTLSAWTFRTR
jgi:hypothetical protein